MDFDTEAADDFQRAVKSWEDDLPYFRSRAGTDSWDCESDNGLLTPPPDSEDDMEKAWDFPPRPTYADSWTRIMKKRVEDGCEITIDQDSDTSSISSLSELYSDDHAATYAYDHPVDSQGYRCPDEDVLAFSGDFTPGRFDGYEGGSTATTSDADDLLAEMIAAYTVPKTLKNAIARASSPRRKRSTSSMSKDKPSGISKLRSPRSSPRLNPRTRSSKR